MPTHPPQILWKPGIFETKGKKSVDANGQTSTTGVRYKVKLKVTVNANSTDYDTWFATAYKWPSWTNKGACAPLRTHTNSSFMSKPWTYNQKLCLTLASISRVHEHTFVQALIGPVVGSLTVLVHSARSHSLSDGKINSKKTKCIVASTIRKIHPWWR